MAEKVLSRIKEIVDNKEESVERNKFRKSYYATPTATPTPPKENKWAKQETGSKPDPKKYPNTREVNGKIYYIMRILDM